jgi:hypothetical protein
MNQHTWPAWMAAVVAIVFGAATIRVEGGALFGDGTRAVGTVGGVVLWFNFLTGIVYVVAGAGLWQRRRWSARLALAIAAVTLLVFAGFGICVAAGGPFDARTVWAMTLRSVVWISIATVALKAVKRDYPANALVQSVASDHAGSATDSEK